MRDGGPGERIEGQDAILAAARARYDVAAFERFYGPIEERPAEEVLRFAGQRTTAEGVDFVRSAREGVAATVTPQHLLLNRNEWNIARVARLMGVTRRTVYLRLQRYGIPRERVPRTRTRVRTAPA